MTANKILSSIATILSACVLLVSCDDKKNAKENFENSPRYDLSSPKIVHLPIELDEISGIAYYPKDTSVFAVIDEDGLLYKIPIKDPSQTRKWVFDKARDYEDLLLRDSTFYALVSNGDIVSIHFQGDSITTEKATFSEESGKKTNEFEGMYLDSNRIIIMCKECEEDKKSKISFFQFNDTSYSPYFSIDASAIAAKMKKNKVELKASAAAINPVTNELYIISSVNKVLLVADRAGNIKELYTLNPKIYKQPEGMAFTPEGDLIISNEVFLENHATLLLLKNKLK
jgi:uncharacterized protein YjiK